MKRRNQVNKRKINTNELVASNYQLSELTEEPDEELALVEELRSCLERLEPDCLKETKLQV